MKRASKDQPWVENYPALWAWLKKHRALCLQQVRLGGSEEEPASFIEMWLIRGGNTLPFFVHIHAEQEGWFIYTQGGSNVIEETLAETEKRLGIEPETMAQAVAR